MCVSFGTMCSCVNYCTRVLLHNKVIRPLSFGEATLDGNIYLDTPENFSYRSYKKREVETLQQDGESVYYQQHSA